MMRQRVTVSRVEVIHTCAGRRSITVYTKAHDETFPSAWHPPGGALDPVQRLYLECVNPGDVIEVLSEAWNGVGLAGTYVTVIERHTSENGTCLCGSSLCSDNYGVWCPNTLCARTLVARMKRLGSTPYSSTLHQEPKHHFLNMDNNPILKAMLGDRTTVEFVFGASNNEHLYAPILEKSWWTREAPPSATLEDILHRSYNNRISMATFLVEDLFRYLVEQVYSYNYRDMSELEGINTVFGVLEECLTRRDVNNPVQNEVMCKFMWGLGLDSLMPKTIESLLNYEMVTEWDNDPFLSYFYVMLNPELAVTDVGLHPIEARCIRQEILSRREEFSDIFKAFVGPAGFQELLKYMG